MASWIIWLPLAIIALALCGYLVMALITPQKW